MAEGAAPDLDQLIMAAAAGRHRVTGAELQAIREYVARAGFNPEPNALAQGLAGVLWQGRVLKGSDRLPSGEVHYLDHVRKQQEWPSGTSLEEYYGSARDTILNPRGQVFGGWFGTRLQLTFFGPTGPWQGPRGSALIMVEYRLEMDHWITAFQPADGFRILRDHRRTGIRWLRRWQ